jgi:hypothetical protein
VTAGSLLENIVICQADPPATLVVRHALVPPGVPITFVVHGTACGDRVLCVGLAFAGSLSREKSIRKRNTFQFDAGCHVSSKIFLFL